MERENVLSFTQSTSIEPNIEDFVSCLHPLILVLKDPFFLSSNELRHVVAFEMLPCINETIRL
jgi:hypothetical protein